MLFSAVDDRSGAVYEEYRCVYGEEPEAALRFLFNAMPPKPEEDMLLQGIPEAIYMDNGPVARARVFENVIASLGIRIMTNMPAGMDGKRVTSRSKGKVERPLRTVKEVHETLYHFHQPKDEAEANLWLRRYLIRYNAQPHRFVPLGLALFLADRLVLPAGRKAEIRNLAAVLESLDFRVFADVAKQRNLIDAISHDVSSN